MDGFLGLLIAIAAFALFIFLIQRSVKSIVLISVFLLGVIAIKTFGLMG
jgi:hypothetical protein